MVYNVTKKNVLEALNKAERLDDRKPFDHRDVSVKFNISKNAEGSVGVKFGKTEVVCGVKMGVAEPYTDHEDEGTMMVTMELLPLSSPNFEYGPPSIEAVEVARIVDRGIRESGFIDFKKLNIKEGEKVWSIFIDLATINDDGNLIDASALAAVLALMTARMPEYDEKLERVKFGEFTDKKLPLVEDKMPLTTTFFKIGEKIFVDPTREEEDAAEGRLTIEIFKPGKEELITAMQKGGEASMTAKEVETMVEEACKIFKKLSSLAKEEAENYNKEKKKEDKAEKKSDKEDKKEEKSEKKSKKEKEE
jgi:exosome complex component RRP42